MTLFLMEMKAKEQGHMIIYFIYTYVFEFNDQNKLQKNQPKNYWE